MELWVGLFGLIFFSFVLVTLGWIIRVIFWVFIAGVVLRMFGVDLRKES